MTELIRQMTAIELPQDLLDRVDVEGLVRNFRDKLKKLDDFRRIRDDHESRSFWKRLGDAITFDDTMENAQLDAVETQASFSKAIGQLMVISIEQSQRLHRQQEQLSAQQGAIKEQTRRIEQHTEKLQEQHEILSKQNSDLEKLVTDFFELRGLTQEGAKMLIAIASDVKATRDHLLSSVDDSLSSFANRLDTALDGAGREATDLRNSVNDSVSRLRDDLATGLQVGEGRSDRLFTEAQAAIAIANENIQQLVKDVGVQRESREQLAKELGARLESLHEEFATYRRSAENKIIVLAGSLGLVAIGLISCGWFLVHKLW